LELYLGAKPPEAPPWRRDWVYGYSYKCTVLSHHDQSIGLNKHKLSLLVNDNAAECNVSQEIMKLSTMAL